MSRLPILAAVLSASLVMLSGALQRTPSGDLAAGQIAGTAWPYLPGSIVPVRVNGFSAPYDVAVVGPGTLLDGGFYSVPAQGTPSTALLIAGNAHGLASRSLHLAPAPNPRDGIIAVASYDDGLVLHDLADFSVLGLLGTGGTPSDAAATSDGRIAVTDTQGTQVTLAAVDPWDVRHVGGVPFGDEIAADRTTGAIFVSNRDVDGVGALTRVSASGDVERVPTGQTAEGVAIDERRQVVYVANVNDDTVAQIDARSMRLMRKFHAVARVFSLALSSDGSRLYAVSNQSAGSPFAAPGSVVALDLAHNPPRRVATSAPLTFPLGIVLDRARRALYVTDESRDVVYVLDPTTLRAKHEPLPTCHTPWKPLLDPLGKRLYVPCARDDRVDVFDTRTLTRAVGAPFVTGGYPLAVAIWHDRPAAKR